MPLGVEDANKMLLLVLIFEDVYRAVSDVRSLNWKYSLHKVAQQDELRHLLKTYWVTMQVPSLLTTRLEEATGELWR